MNAKTPSVANSQLQRKPNPNANMQSAASRNRLGITDFLSELPAIFDRPDFVQGQTFEPQLLQPYQVSFQDRINANNANFRGYERTLGQNPAALATLASQRYDANNAILGEQFRVNQGIQNQVINQNNQIVNNAALTNLQLADQQYVRQQQAKAITEDRKQQAIASLSNKFAQNRRDNNSIRLAENLFNFRPDENLNMQYTGELPNFYFPNTSAVLPPQDQDVLRKQQMARKNGGTLTRKIKK